ncbi:MAG TPA: hypothetical protein VFR34_13485 [Paracoccaceae bacterium]|nr:hypothetical protein [Paracoccaceae bacterium]
MPPAAEAGEGVAGKGGLGGIEGDGFDAGLGEEAVELRYTGAAASGEGDDRGFEQRDRGNPACFGPLDLRDIEEVVGIPEENCEQCRRVDDYVGRPFSS